MDESTPTSPQGWVDYVGHATSASLLAVAIVTNYLGLWVTAPIYKEMTAQRDSMKAERDQWQGIALKAVKIAEGDYPGAVGAAGPHGVNLNAVKARVEALEKESGRP